jgi:hypothetical protein
VRGSGEPIAKRRAWAGDRVVANCRVRGGAVGTRVSGASSGARRWIGEGSDRWVVQREGGHWQVGHNDTWAQVVVT